MHTTYDPDANAVYIDVGSGPTPGSSVRQLPMALPDGRGELIVDLDEAGRILGIEVLGARACLPAGLLASSHPPGPPH